MHYQELRKKLRCSWNCSDRKSVKRILVFGDSNAFHSDGKCACWPSLLKEKDPSKLNVFNESCDGRTTKYDIGEYCGLNVIGNKLVSHAPLDYVVVMLGTNDMKSIYGSPSASEIADGMRRILDIIDKSGGGAKPILLTPPPMGNVNSGDLAGAQFRTDFVAAEYLLQAMNSDARLVDTHAILDTGTDIESDMIHLNALGRQKVADALWKNLNQGNPPPQVKGVSAVNNGPDFILSWLSIGPDIFYYRVRRNGDIIGRTMEALFIVTSPAISDSFTVEAVDYSQNTGKASQTVNCRKRKK